MSHFALALAIMLAAVPPLADDELAQWRAVKDTGAMIDEPLLPIILEHITTWTDNLGDAPIRLSFNRDALLNQPDRFRGELFQLTGIVHQHATLETGEIRVSELFLRDEHGEPLAVYLPVGSTSPPGEGRPVVIIARFVKLIEEPARDGRTYRYPAFAGRISTAAPAANTGLGNLPFVAIPVGVLLVIFTLVFVFTRRRPPAARKMPKTADLPALDESAALPDDPVEALAELRRRAEA